MQSSVVLAALFALAAAAPAGSAAEPRKIVLIGGEKSASEGFGQHDYPNGIRLLEAWLNSSPQRQAGDGLSVVAFPDGWPADPAALDGAATLVWYFDGNDRHPLIDPGRRALVEALMAKGVGLVALHQATTVPADDTSIGLERWLGGARYGMYDRTTERVEFAPASHAASRGVPPFSYNDEFYPTIRFAKTGRVAPVLTGRLHPEYRDGESLVIGRGERATVAWAFAREDGGRAFGFSGAHYLASLDEPALRRLLLNAVLWTAHAEVPVGGVASVPEGAARAALDAAKKRRVTEAVVARHAETEVHEMPWGRLTWFVSGALGNSDTMTVGMAVIRPGQENPLHYHPNCDEVLHVLKGRILQTAGEKSFEMSAGDTVSIPIGTHHQSRNVGDEDAVLLVSFSSADRKTVNE